MAGQFQAQRSLGDGLKDIRGNTIPWSQLQNWQGQPLKALAGIARPEVFFHMLRDCGLDLAQTLPLPDHVDVSPEALAAMQPCQLICTEKDAIKVWAHVPSALTTVLIQTLEPAFFEALNRQIAQASAPRLSLDYGH